MEKWKDEELDTVRIYEQVGLIHPGCLSKGIDDYAPDQVSVTCPSMSVELKTCYSTHHCSELYSKGCDANAIGYLRVDQLKEYRKEFIKRPGKTLRFYLDCRILDLKNVAHVQDFIDGRDLKYTVKKRWNVCTFTITELWNKKNYCIKSEVPEKTKHLYSNKTDWDGKLLLVDLRQFTTTDLTPWIPRIGIPRLLKARTY